MLTALTDAQRIHYGSAGPTDRCRFRHTPVGRLTVAAIYGTGHPYARMAPARPTRPR
jgi:hypothetical protein